MGDQRAHLLDAIHRSAVDELRQGEYVLAPARAQRQHSVPALPPV